MAIISADFNTLFRPLTTTAADDLRRLFYAQKQVFDMFMPVRICYLELRNDFIYGFGLYIKKIE